MIKLLPLALMFPLVLSSPASAETRTFTAISGGKNVGHLIAETKGDVTTVDFNVKDNGWTRPVRAPQSCLRPAST
jgi:hypothetical protein